MLRPMLLAEDGLPLLLDELGRLPARDRRAILERLSADERERLARLVDDCGTAARPAYSQDIEARIAALRAGDNDAVTQAAAEALRRLLDIVPAVRPARKPQPGASLMDSLGGMLRRGRGSP